MTTVEKIERDIRELPASDLRRLREWFVQYDAGLWDRQIEEDAAQGKLESFAAEAVEEHQAGSAGEI